jgi:RNA polymerase sigma factor (sigma-70 family)
MSEQHSRDDLAPLTDAELIARILGGDEDAAVHLLVGRCGAALKYLAEVSFRDLGLEFHEVIGEAYLHLSANDWHALRAFRGHAENGRSCSLKSYVVLIVSRLLLRKFKNRAKSLDWLAPLMDMEGYEFPDARADRERLALEVFDAIAALDNVMDRDILLLYKIEGRGAEEVAAQLNTTPGNVRTRYCRAKEALRALLEGDNVHA